MRIWSAYRKDIANLYTGYVRFLIQLSTAPFSPFYLCLPAIVPDRQFHLNFMKTSDSCDYWLDWSRIFYYQQQRQGQAKIAIAQEVGLHFKIALSYLASFLPVCHWTTKYSCSLCFRIALFWDRCLAFITEQLDSPVRITTSWIGCLVLLTSGLFALISFCKQHYAETHFTFSCWRLVVSVFSGTPFDIIVLVLFNI